MQHPKTLVHTWTWKYSWQNTKTNKSYKDWTAGQPMFNDMEISGIVSQPLAHKTFVRPLKTLGYRLMWAPAFLIVVFSEVNHITWLFTSCFTDGMLGNNVFKSIYYL